MLSTSRRSFQGKPRTSRATRLGISPVAGPPVAVSETETRQLLKESLSNDNYGRIGYGCSQCRVMKVLSVELLTSC